MAKGSCGKNILQSKESTFEECAPFLWGISFFNDKYKDKPKIFTFTSINIPIKKMAKAVKSKPTKQRAKKYEEKLSIDGSFADVFKVVKKNKERKQEVKK